jgi:hypothetical protein
MTGYLRLQLSWIADSGEKRSNKAISTGEGRRKLLSSGLYNGTELVAGSK